VDYLANRYWRPVEKIDLGTTADVYVVERDGTRRVVKVGRDGGADGRALLTEYRVLAYLNQTPMRRYVPWVAGWLDEIDGFVMEYLRYPTRAERSRADWMPALARALRTLHSLAVPTMPELPDDRPDPGAALQQRWRVLFERVWRSDIAWSGLSEQDRRRLNRVRDRYGLYIDLLAEVAERLADAEVALTHGDLAGDNVMVTPQGRLALADWGTARIGAALADVASLITYSSWSTEETHRFYELYLDRGAMPRDDAVASLDLLTRLHRYRSCVQSLIFLNDENEGLDEVGRTHFARQLAAL
jgi:aminoglycoside phosphotransferase (APT) family kinase protein